MTQGSLSSQQPLTLGSSSGPLWITRADPLLLVPKTLLTPMGSPHQCPSLTSMGANCHLCKPFLDLLVFPTGAIFITYHRIHILMF